MRTCGRFCPVSATKLGTINQSEGSGCFIIPSLHGPYENSSTFGTLLLMLSLKASLLPWLKPHYQWTAAEIICTN